ncbi:hypothetical protein HBB16_01245 [Pseudonocardia sp. MCCB 268]|nr:hypothetical protein [Pseudonocardia cytotoxica]
MLSADTVVTVPVDLPGGPAPRSASARISTSSPARSSSRSPTWSRTSSRRSRTPKVLLASGSARMPVADAGPLRQARAAAGGVRRSGARRRRGLALAVAVAGTVQPLARPGPCGDRRRERDRACGRGRQPAGAAMGPPGGGVPAGSWAAPRIPAPRGPGTPPGGVPAGPRVPRRPVLSIPFVVVCFNLSMPHAKPRRAGSDRTAGVLATPPARHVPAPRAGGGAAVAPEAAEQATAASSAGQRADSTQDAVRPHRDRTEGLAGPAPPFAPRCMPRARRPPRTRSSRRTPAEAAALAPRPGVCWPAQARSPVCGQVVAGALLLWPSSPASIGELSAAPTMPAPPQLLRRYRSRLRRRSPGRPVAVWTNRPASPPQAATAPAEGGHRGRDRHARRTAAPAPDHIPRAVRPEDDTPVPGPVVPPRPRTPRRQRPGQTPVTPEPTTGAPRRLPRCHRSRRPRRHRRRAAPPAHRPHPRPRERAREPRSPTALQRQRRVTRPSGTAPGRDDSDHRSAWNRAPRRLRPLRSPSPHPVHEDCAGGGRRAVRPHPFDVVERRRVTGEHGLRGARGDTVGEGRHRHVCSGLVDGLPTGFRLAGPSGRRAPVRGRHVPGAGASADRTSPNCSRERRASNSERRLEGAAERKRTRGRRPDENGFFQVSPAARSRCRTAHRTVDRRARRQEPMAAGTIGRCRGCSDRPYPGPRGARADQDVVRRAGDAVQHDRGDPQADAAQRNWPGQRSARPAPLRRPGSRWFHRHLKALHGRRAAVRPDLRGAGDAGQYVAMTALYAQVRPRRVAQPVHRLAIGSSMIGLALVAGSAGQPGRHVLRHWTIVTVLVAALVLFMRRRWR